MNSSPDTKRYGMTMFVLMWVMLIAVFAFLFQHWFDAAQNPNQNIATRVNDSGAKEVVLVRNRYGHYVASGQINGHPVTFFLDTGASDVSVPESLANAIGLRKGAEITLNTANGLARGWQTRLDTVQLGDIRLHEIRASINPNVNFDEVLLGMSFLKKIEFTQRGDILTLRQLPDASP